MNALIEMTSLSLHRPAVNAPDSEVAAWYLAKGRMHEQMATGPDAAQELAYAEQAYEHARRLAVGR